MSRNRFSDIILKLIKLTSLCSTFCENSVQKLLQKIPKIYNQKDLSLSVISYLYSFNFGPGFVG